MISMFRATTMLLPMALGACSDAQHPLDRQLSNLKPIVVVPLEGMPWPGETLLCPLTPYQSALPGDSSTARQVNAFLGRKQFRGEEGYWSLVVVKPAPAGDVEIEQLIFKRDKYDVVTSSTELGAGAEPVPVNFKPKECVTAGEARVLVTRGGASNRKIVSFGTQI